MTHVPAIFYGWHKKRESFNKKEITQIATISQKIKIAFPNGTKNVLEEVLDDK
jgi:hypothetical protein